MSEKRGRMRTFGQMHDDAGSCVYWGERQAWYVVAGRSRESEAWEESNFRSILKRLDGESDTVAIERESHWAVGWVEHVLIHPGDASRLTIAQELRDGLEDYPIVDEEDWSNLESEQFFDFAKGELDRFGDGWQDAFNRACDASNSGAGDPSAEWAIIEAARAELEAAEEAA